MKNLTFNELPSAVGQLYEKLESIERLLKAKGDQIQVESSGKNLTVKEAAKFLNLAVPTVYSMVSRGELPHMKRSKRLYFDRDELLQYLKAGRRSTNEEAMAEAVHSFKGRRA